MKKGISIILVCLLSTILLGCGGMLGNIYHNKKADDAISRAIYEAVGAKELYYQGKSESTSKTQYSYYIYEEKEGVIEEAIEAVNRVLEQETADTSIIITFYRKIPGSLESLFSVCNSSDRHGTYADYTTLQGLKIWGSTVGSEESIYNDPATYINFPDIRCLWVEEKIQEVADAAGIDWYEYWPDLEKVEVYSLKN